MEDGKKLSRWKGTLNNIDLEGNSSYVKGICSRKGNSDQWEYERKLCRRKGTVTKGKMEEALKTERIPSTKQGNADH
jgi:hypothetical protein